MDENISGDFTIDRTAKLGRDVVLRGTGRIGANVVIGNFVVIEGEIEINDNTRIDHHVVIAGKTSIGRNSRIGSFCSIGMPAQHPAYDPEIWLGDVKIGDGTILREYVSVHMPTTDGTTSIGDNCYVMVYCDIGHDAVIDNNVKIASGCTVAGHVHVESFSYLGLHSTIHQRLHIGTCSMIGMNTPVMKHVLPYSTIIQQSFSKINRPGLTLLGLSETDIDRIDKFYRELGSLDPDRLNPSSESDPLIEPIIRFLQMSIGKHYLPEIR